MVERAAERARGGCAWGGQSWKGADQGSPTLEAGAWAEETPAHLLVANKALQLSPNKADRQEFFSYS